METDNWRKISVNCICKFPNVSCPTFFEIYIAKTLQSNFYVLWGYSSYKISTSFFYFALIVMKSHFRSRPFVVTFSKAKKRNLRCFSEIIDWSVDFLKKYLVYLKSARLKVSNDKCFDTFCDVFKIFDFYRSSANLSRSESLWDILIIWNLCP